MRLQEFLKQVDREGMDPYIARLQKRQRKQRRYAPAPPRRSTGLHCRLPNGAIDSR